jgi:serine/threonine-protein kinase
MSDLLKPGQIFAGRYRVEAFLSKGGFGVVYAAEQIDTEAKVALKVLWPHLLESDTAVDQFKLEARLPNRIASEYVVRVFDVGRDADTDKPFLAMELLEGDDFETIVQEQGPIPTAKLAVYFRQIGSALEKAHGYVDREGQPRPIVHRDLKPENLFLTHRETGEPCVKIVDFGLAKVLGESGRTSNEFKGTPMFMSYEQASVGIITPQTDIWAVGLIAFYFLTGRPYWLTANNADTPITRIFSEVLSGPMAKPSDRARALGAPVIPSDAFDAWFTRCVTRNHGVRYETVGECVAALLAVFPTASGDDAPQESVRGSPDTLLWARSIPDTPASAHKTLESARPPSSIEPISPPTDVPEKPESSSRIPTTRLPVVPIAIGLLLLTGVSFLSLRTQQPNDAMTPQGDGRPLATPVVTEGRRTEISTPAPTATAFSGVPTREPGGDGGDATPVTARPPKTSLSIKRTSQKPVPPVPSEGPVWPSPPAPTHTEEDPYGTR